MNGEASGSGAAGRAKVTERIDFLSRRRERRTKFKHPGYPEPNNVFLTLPQGDYGASTATRKLNFGVHHNTARIAYGILAGNHFRTPYFAVNRDAVVGVAAGHEELLTEDEYYFIIPGNPLYPLVATFRDWIFPHDELERLWPENIHPERAVNASCSITKGRSDTSLHTYIIPLEEKPWFITNEMDPPPMIGFRDPTTAKINHMFLRPDLHAAFQLGSFAIVPKKTVLGMRFTMTVLLNYPRGDWAWSHGSFFHASPQVSNHYLFARFAWAIFVHANPRIGVGDECTVLRLFQAPDSKMLSYKREKITLSQLKN
ncbi:hypothetical protein ACQKWADRAFT_283006 [Trichoderma austrokoningii]